jgi:signal transduction histidine kinase
MFDKLYEKKWWKYALLIFAFLIAVMSLLYTNSLVDRLSKEEKRKAELWANAYKHLNQMGDEMGDITFLLDVIRSNETVPVILVDENDNIVSAKNLNEDRINQEAYLREQLEIMKAGHAPIEIEYAEGAKNYIYYKDSVIVQQLRYFPYAQLFVISIFLLVAYLAFNASRRYEQNRVWVGMAKETAHQLGTPLSSLIAWVEYFKEAGELKLDKSIVTELEKDLNRLTVVTERFSKIGSSPILKKENMLEVLNQSVEYFNTRISKKISIKFNNHGNEDIHAFISRPLFEWVIENLLKNAIDAMNGEGSIVIELSETNRHIIIDISDTGKGIARSDFENVFKPGFSTRRRGWGLGLSLAKRIISNYHKGEIFVKESEIGKGTVMRIRLLN